MRKKLAAGNWKMNGLRASLGEVKTLSTAYPAPGCDVVLCLPATLLGAAQPLAGAVALGAQDCHIAVSGAHTGDLSAEMLCDTGASHVILGHSERRTDHSESDALVADKARAASAAGLTSIICLGESLAQREAGETLAVVEAQLTASVPQDIAADRLVIAYEPIWAIGTGKVPTLAQIAQVHDALRARLTAHIGADAAQVPLLYGGSVKPNNAAEIFATSNVDGALVGGASLKAADFSQIIDALQAAP